MSSTRGMVSVDTQQELEDTSLLYLDWVALIAGCSVGFIWWVLHRKYFTGLYWSLVEPFQSFQPLVDGLPWKFDFLYAVLNVSTALLQSLTVGFMTGCVARQHPYPHSLVAMLLTFPLKFLKDIVMFDFDSGGGRHPYETWWVGVVLAAVYVGGPLGGAYLAQRLRRSRMRRG